MFTTLQIIVPLLFAIIGLILAGFYTLEMDGKLFLIENVPTRVNVEQENNFSHQNLLTA